MSGRISLRRFFPPADWLRGYDASFLRSDLTAGLTVGVMLIPQGMAYALIAGLPPIYGLYASVAPLVVYALLGTSRQLAVGPVAMVSLLVAAGVAPLAEGGSADYLRLAIVLALMVGVVQLALGFARFGFLVNFLSHPVLAGFTSAAALIIGASQLKNLLGIPIERSNYIHEILISAFAQAADIHMPTLAIGLGAIAALVLLRRWKKTFPGAIVVVIVTTAAVWGAQLHATGVGIVGDVPRGLPAFSAPVFSITELQTLLPTALIIALVGFMESIAVAKTFASRHRYRIDANQELVALGAANIVGAFFKAFPTTGGFSRTAVNADAGAQSTIATVVSAMVIVLTLLFLTPLFYYMPNAILAAVIMVAVAGLVDVKELVFLWRVDRREFTLMLLTFAATLALGIEEGILVGVIASLVMVVQRATTPHTARLGRLPDSTTYRNLDRNPSARAPEGITILRIDASLYFANTEYLRDLLGGVSDRAVILDMYPVNKIDSSALHVLGDVLESLRDRGVRLALSGLKGPVRDVLRRAGTLDKVGAENVFAEVHEAVEALDGAKNTHVPDKASVDV